MRNKNILVLFICLMSTLASIQVSAQTLPVMRMDSAIAIGSHKARFVGTIVSRGSWSVKGVGFLYAQVNSHYSTDTVKYKKNNPQASLTKYDYTTVNTAYYLKPNTQYWVKAFAWKTGPNDTVFSEPIYFTTGIDTCTTFSLSEVTDIDMTEATLHGTITNIGDCESVSSCGFIYSTTPNPTAGTAGAIMVTTRSSALAKNQVPITFTRRLSNLYSGMTYYVRMWSSNKFNNYLVCNDTCYSDQISFTTHHACGFVPLSLDTVSVGINEAELHWVSNAGQTRFEVDYGFAGHTAGEGTLIRTDTTYIHLNNLTSNRTYTSYVRAVCDDIYSDWSNLKSFKTREAECEKVGSIHTESVDYFTAKIVWTPGTNTQSAWDVLFAKQSEAYPSTPYTVTGEAEYIPVGLTENTTYKIKIRGNCQTSVSQWSDEYTFKTSVAGLDDADNNQNNKVKVYPNPTSGKINFEGNLHDVIRLEIYSSIGTLVYKSESMPKDIDLSSYGKGIYTLYITKPSGVQLERIIIN